MHLIAKTWRSVIKRACEGGLGASPPQGKFLISDWPSEIVQSSREVRGKVLASLLVQLRGLLLLRSLSVASVYLQCGP